MWTRLVACCSRVGFAWARRRLDAEARREFDAHLDLLTDRYVRSGMAPAEARETARRQFGNATLIREDLHHMNGFTWLDQWRQDLAYAVRQLRRSPGFSAVVIATLGVGIGGTTAVFSVVQAVVLAPLPYDRPNELVRLFQRDPATSDTRDLTAPHFGAIRENASLFADVAALYTYGTQGLDLFQEGGAQRLRVLRVTSDYFRTLRPGTLRGPGFVLGDETGVRRIVLSDAVWRARFRSDLAAIGSTIRLSGESYEVAGIAASGFDDPLFGDVDAWLPYNLASGRVASAAEEDYGLGVVARLRRGVTLDQAQAELANLSREMRARWPATRMSDVVAVPLQDDRVAPSRGILRVLLIAVVLLLVVACVNVANLVLVRAIGRTHEFALRAALGSGRRRLTRQLLVEGLPLAGLGGLLGLALAMFGLEILRRFGRDAMPRIDEVGFDPRVLAVAALMTITTAVIAGVAPMVRLARVSPSQALAERPRGATVALWQAQLRNGLAIAQVAIALPVLVGAGVFLASFARLQQVDLGFRVDQVLTFEVNLPTSRYDAGRRASFNEELTRRITAIPGVTAAGATSYLPAAGDFHHWPTSIDSGPLSGTRITQIVQQRTVSGDFFAALEIPVLAGRVFDSRDDQSMPGRAVVSEDFARRAFPGVSLDHVVGQRIRVLGAHRREIVGVVDNVALDVFGTTAPAVYHAHRQFADNRNWALTQVVAAEIPPSQLASAVRDVVAALDPELVVYRPASMSDVVGRKTSRERFALVLMCSFAAIVLLLAVLGLYGVLSYAVRQRTQEIGVRMALGATAAQVRTSVLRHAALVLALGIVPGVVGALALGGLLSSLVFQTSPSDPRILVSTVAMLAAAGLFAAWLPARRASRIEPRIAMQDGPQTHG